MEQCNQTLFPLGRKWCLGRHVQTVLPGPKDDSGHARQYSCTRPYVLSQRLKKGGPQQEQCLGRSRGGFSSKIHLLVDALGLPLKFILTADERNDMTQAESLHAPFGFDAVIADKGYDSDPLRELLAAQQVEMVIPSRRNRKQRRDYDENRYRERNIVGRFIKRSSGIDAFSLALTNSHDGTWLSGLSLLH